MARRLPLGPRLALAFALPATVALLACGGVAYVGTRNQLEEELGKRLCAVATVVAQGIPKDLALALEPGDDETRTAQNIRRRLEQALQGTGVSRVLLVDPALTVHLETGSEFLIGAQMSRLSMDRVEMDRALAGTATPSVLFSGPDGTLYKSCYAPVPGDGPPLLIVVQGAADLFRTLTGLGILYLVLLALALGVLTSVAYAVARQIAVPLFKLSQDARVMGQGHLERPVSVVTDDEVGQVARALDEMRQQLRARDEERQMMLAGIAHEVRNPLGGMELYAGILAETVADLPGETPAHLTDELKNAVGRIRRELGYLGGVVNDFLSFARDVPAQRREVNVKSLMQEVLSLASAEATKRNTQLILSPAVDEKLSLQVDDGQVRGALLNLVQNAVQACPDNAKVELNAQRVDGMVALSVADNGPGMSQESLQKALTPFFTTKEKGTGLGLPLVVKTARTHGGRLDVKTSPGQGFTATMLLPVTRS